VKEFRFEHVFAGRADDYWWAFFDEGCTRQQFDAVGVRGFEIIELSDNGDEVVRILEVSPARDLPGFIRKLTGASLRYTETSRLDRRSGIATTEVVPATLSGRVELRGTHRLEPVDADHVRRVFTGTIAARVPLVGKRIETAVLADMEKSYATGAALTQSFMDARRAADR
jgi:hypothetical protein